MTNETATCHGGCDSPVYAYWGVLPWCYSCWSDILRSKD